MKICRFRFNLPFEWWISETSTRTHPTPPHPLVLIDSLLLTNRSIFVGLLPTIYMRMNTAIETKPCLMNSISNLTQWNACAWLEKQFLDGLINAHQRWQSFVHCTDSLPGGAHRLNWLLTDSCQIQFVSATFGWVFTLGRRFRIHELPLNWCDVQFSKVYVIYSRPISWLFACATAFWHPYALSQLVSELL